MITDRKNNFGFLRLLFASLVIVSHSPELVDGNRSREILTRIFGTMSFGEISVDGFFLISGYLITQSFVRSSSTFEYLLKRVLRIVPGYAVSFVLCVLLVAPFAGNGVTWSFRLLEILLSQMLTLFPPTIAGAFDGLPYPLLNGAMWTIAYEFRCYLAVAMFGLLGIYRPRYRVVAAIAVAVLLLLNATGAMQTVHPNQNMLLGVAAYNTRFGAVFGVGFFREWYTRRSARRMAYMRMKADEWDIEPEERNPDEISRRRLVRRSHFMTIVAAWVVTVPMAAILAAVIYWAMVALFV